MTLRTKRTSWIYCPAVNVDDTPCRHDLNGDNKSFVDEADGIVNYTCAACGFNSLFAVDTPAPIYVGPWGFHATGQCGGVCKHCEFHPETICGQDCSGCCTEDEN